MRVSTPWPFWPGEARQYPERAECEGNGEVSARKGRGDLRPERFIMKSLIRSLRRDFHARLDVSFRLINECADPDNGQHDAARNKISSTADPGNARLPVRRLGGVLAGRMEQTPAALSGNGRAGRVR